MTPSDVDLFELNEAFAAVGIASMPDLGISDDIVNVNGGVIALGHPSVCRARRSSRHQRAAPAWWGRGCGALCGGGGQGDAAIIPHAVTPTRGTRYPAKRRNRSPVSSVGAWCRISDHRGNRRDARFAVALYRARYKKLVLVHGRCRRAGAGAERIVLLSAQPKGFTFTFTGTVTPQYDASSFTVRFGQWSSSQS